MKKYFLVAATMAIGALATFPVLAQDETPKMLSEFTESQIKARICQMYAEDYTYGEIREMTEYLVRVNRTDPLPSSSSTRALEMREINGSIISNMLMMLAVVECVTSQS